MDRWELEAAAAKVTYMRGLLALPLGAVFILVGLTIWSGDRSNPRGCSSWAWPQPAPAG